MAEDEPRNFDFEFLKQFGEPGTADSLTPEPFTTASSSGNDLSKLVETLSIARRCRRTIMQNFVGTLVVDSIGVGLPAFGFLNPLLAVFIHVSSEMTFILNSARLLPSVSSAKKLVRGIFSQPSAVTED